VRVPNAPLALFEFLATDLPHEALREVRAPERDVRPVIDVLVRELVTRLRVGGRALVDKLVSTDTDVGVLGSLVVQPRYRLNFAHAIPYEPSAHIHSLLKCFGFSTQKHSQQRLYLQIPAD